MQNSETVRATKKEAIQPLFLSTSYVGQDSDYFGRFLGLSDSKAKFLGNELVSFKRGKYDDTQTVISCLGNFHCK